MTFNKELKLKKATRKANKEAKKLQKAIQRTERALEEAKRLKKEFGMPDKTDNIGSPTRYDEGGPFDSDYWNRVSDYYDSPDNLTELEQISEFGWPEK